MSTREHGKILQVGPGVVILREGDRGNAAYEIVRGCVEVLTERSGRRVMLARLGRGQVFGEMGLIADTARTANVVAVEPCTVRLISRRVFERLLKRDPKKILPVVNALFDRLRRMNAKYLLSLEDQWRPPRPYGRGSSISGISPRAKYRPVAHGDLTRNGPCPFRA